MLNNVEFQQKYSEYHDLLFGFAMKLTRNLDNAHDLMQETACRAYKHRAKFMMGTNFKAWMTTIMRNTFINGYRKRRTRNKVEAPIEDFLFAIENKTINGTAESRVMMGELKEILNRLSTTYRVPFVMFVKGYQYQEIAEQLDIPIGTVKSRIYSARQNMQQMIKENYGSSLHV
ncbi:MAG: RNA polymerase sigma factor [Saprospiraceae bacterium]|nr:MAG: RNA polymerase sigma factor [Saprospiraceae bacterium]